MHYMHWNQIFGLYLKEEKNNCLKLYSLLLLQFHRTPSLGHRVICALCDDNMSVSYCPMIS